MPGDFTQLQPVPKASIWVESQASIWVESQASIWVESQASIWVESQASIWVESQASIWVESQASIWVESQASIWVESQASIWVESQASIWVESQATNAWSSVVEANRNVAFVSQTPSSTLDKIKPWLLEDESSNNNINFYIAHTPEIQINALYNAKKCTQNKFKKIKTYPVQVILFWI